MTANLPVINVIAEALPAPIVPNTSLIAAELVRFSTEAEKAVGIAGRAVINDDESAGRGADVIGSINLMLRELEKARKEKTAPYDSAKTTLTGLYGAAKTKFESAKTLLSNKVLGYNRAETARRAAEAAAAQKAQQEQAARMAAAQAALGDEEGAEQIIVEAAALVVEPEKVVAKGSYGSSGGERKRPVGAITDKRAFLSWALSPQGSSSIVDSITIGQAALNVLASDVLNSEGATVPGFTAEYDSKLIVR